MVELNDSAGSPFANVFVAVMDSAYTNIIEVDDANPDAVTIVEPPLLASDIIEVVDTNPDAVTIVEPPPLASGQIGNLGEYNIKDTWGRTW